MTDNRIAYRIKIDGMFSSWNVATRDALKKILAAEKHKITRVEVMVYAKNSLYIWTPSLGWHEHESWIDCEAYINFATNYWDKQAQRDLTSVKERFAKRK